MLPLHLGRLHGVEVALTFLLAFGPFLVAVLVAVLHRRRASSDTGSGEVADRSSAALRGAGQPLHRD